MKRYFAIATVLLLGLILMGAVFPSSLRWAFPGNIVVQELNTAAVGAGDTIIYGTPNLYGPYPVCLRTRDYPYNSVRLHFPAATVQTGDTLVASYQLLPDSVITDTISGKWTIIDSVLITGLYADVISLDNVGARGIVFRMEPTVDTTIVSKAIRSIWEF